MVLSFPMGVEDTTTVSGNVREIGLKESLISINKDDYTNFTEPGILVNNYSIFRIYINDYDVNYNSSKTAAENDWLKGSGTYSDPFILENLYINTQGGGGIYIRFSSSYFIIRNNWFDNDNPNLWDDGIFVFQSRGGNVRIENNTITNFYNGISLMGSVTNSTISNNIMVNTFTSAALNKGRAIQIDGQCDNNTIEGNIIVDFREMLYVWSSNNIYTKNNYAVNNFFTEADVNNPIYLRETNYSRITNNTMAGGFAYGVFALKNTGGIGNIVEFNTVVTNSTDFLDTTLSISSDLQTQQSEDNVVTLVNSNYNYIGYNTMLLPSDDYTPQNSEDPEDPDTTESPKGIISGYDFIILISIASVTLLTILVRRRKR